MEPFIAHDWCGWNDQFGRYTTCFHDGKCDTLVCKGWMGQLDWDKAQLEWFKQFVGRGLVVYECPGAYQIDKHMSMGTVDEIVARLERRVPAEIVG